MAMMKRITHKRRKDYLIERSEKRLMMKEAEKVSRNLEQTLFENNYSNTEQISKFFEHFTMRYNSFYNIGQYPKETIENIERDFEKLNKSMENKHIRDLKKFNLELPQENIFSQKETLSWWNELSTSKKEKYSGLYVVIGDKKVLCYADWDPYLDKMVEGVPEKRIIKIYSPDYRIFEGDTV